MTENLEQRTGSSSFAGKALRIGVYVAVTALGVAGGYYAGQYAGAEKTLQAEQAAQKAQQRVNELETKMQENDLLERIKKQYAEDAKKGVIPEAHKDP
jgi:uncharacterized protein HemX